MEASSRRTWLKRAARNTAALLDAAVAASGHGGSWAPVAAAASRSRTPARISCIHRTANPLLFDYDGAMLLILVGRGTQGPFRKKQAECTAALEMDMNDKSW